MTQDEKLVPYYQEVRAIIGSFCGLAAIVPEAVARQAHQPNIDNNNKK